MYQCVICHDINSAKRSQCKCCGAIPRQYSVIKKPARLIEHDNLYQFIEVTDALGCLRAEDYRSDRIRLRTMPLDYYGE